MRIGKFELDWKHVALAALVAALYFGSFYLEEDDMARLRADMGYVWGIIATFMGPVIKRQISEALATPTAAAAEDEEE